MYGIKFGIYYILQFFLNPRVNFRVEIMTSFGIKKLHKYFLLN